VAVATGWAVATPWRPVLSVVVTDICEIYGHGIGVAGTGLDEVFRMPVRVFVFDSLD